MKILTAAQMREMDRLTVERCGIPYPTLMETAGARVVEAIIEQYGSVEGKKVVVYCGKGNNGGDGAVIARLLWMRGAKVGVTLFGKVEDTKGEARTNFEALKQLTIAEEEKQKSSWEVARQIEMQTEDVYQTLGYSFQPSIFFREIEWNAGMHIVDSNTDIVVDALFGTGISRSVKAPYDLVIDLINSLRRERHFRKNKTVVVSVDIPSGLSSDTSQPIGPHVKADLTVSFTAPKIGNLLPPASYANGKLVVASIGTPEWLLEEAGAQLQLVEEKQITEFLQASRRAPDAHKGSVGDVLLIAGARGKTGAAALASEAVLRAGAGLVTVATSLSAQSLLVTQSRTEVMTESLAETERGAIAHEALAQAIELARKRTVIAIGPGLSSIDESTRRFVRDFIAQRTTPVVIDADGLNALAPWPAALRGSDELPIIITPHPGEMARLTGKTNAEVVADRVTVAREFATQYHVITILKGSRSLIAAPDGQVYVNPTGNAGMATAGSGDVLTGLLAGLLAQKPDEALSATIAAVYLHGLAGDLAAKQLGQRSLMAGDLSNYIAAAILQIGGAAEKGVCP